VHTSNTGGYTSNTGWGGKRNDSTPPSTCMSCIQHACLYHASRMPAYAWLCKMYSMLYKVHLEHTHPHLAPWPAGNSLLSILHLLCQALLCCTLPPPPFCEPSRSRSSSLTLTTQHTHIEAGPTKHTCNRLHTHPIIPPPQIKKSPPAPPHTLRLGLLAILSCASSISSASRCCAAR
jgi:hypothetical protein